MIKDYDDPWTIMREQTSKGTRVIPDMFGNYDIKDKVIHMSKYLYDLQAFKKSPAGKTVFNFMLFSEIYNNIRDGISFTIPIDDNADYYFEITPTGIYEWYKGELIETYKVEFVDIPYFELRFIKDGEVLKIEDMEPGDNVDNIVSCNDLAYDEIER